MQRSVHSVSSRLLLAVCKRMLGKSIRNTVQDSKVSEESSVVIYIVHTHVVGDSFESVGDINDSSLQAFQLFVYATYVVSERVSALLHF